MTKPYWITYAWADNVEGDVAYFFQELRRHDIPFNADKYSIGAGVSLWDQIGKTIADPSLSGGWALYATPASFESSACREEFDTALRRAIAERGTGYPAVGVFPGSFDQNILPESLKNRLCVSLLDDNWAERLRAALERRAPRIVEATVSRIAATCHADGDGVVWEFRSRMGEVTPIAFGVAGADLHSVGIDATEPFWISRSQHPFPETIRIENLDVLAIAVDGVKCNAIENASISPTRSLYVARKRKDETLIFVTLIDGKWVSLGAFSAKFRN